MEVKRDEIVDFNETEPASYVVCSKMVSLEDEVEELTLVEIGLTLLVNVVWIEVSSEIEVTPEVVVVPFDVDNVVKE